MNKKGIFKKVTAFTLALSMVITLLPCNSVFAEETDGSNGITTESQTGDENSFPISDEENTEQSDSTEEPTEATTEEVTTEEQTSEEATTEEVINDSTIE